MNPSDINEEIDYDIDLINEGSQVVLLRHAKTVFNEAQTVLNMMPTWDESEMIALNTLEEMRDWKLTSFGFEQCDKAEEAAAGIKVHTVFISPFRRALQTAYEIFKSHPQLNDIKFVLMPKMREGLNTSNDIPVDIEEVCAEYSSMFPNFDTSELDSYPDPKHYFIEDLNEPVREMFKSKLQPKESDWIGSNAFDIIAEYIGI